MVPVPQSCSRCVSGGEAFHLRSMWAEGDGCMSRAHHSLLSFYLHVDAGGPLFLFIFVSLTSISYYIGIFAEFLYPSIFPQDGSGSLGCSMSSTAL